MSSKVKGQELEEISEVIARAYKIREKMFTSALEKVVLALSNDRISKQMLKSPTSQNFISNRIQEVFEQIICDDRDAYIAKIIQKLESYDKMYKEEQQEIVKALGTKILKQYDQPKRGTIQRISHIHVLIDQILKLRAEIEHITSENLEHAKLLNVMQKKTRIDYTPNSPTFMHVFAEVDVTEMSKTIRALQSENEMTRESFELLYKNTSKIIRLMRSKTIAAVNLYKSKIDRMDKLLKREKNSNNKIQEEYSGQLEQLKREVQAKSSEIESLKKLLNSKTNNENQLNAQRVKYEQDINAVHQENEDLKLQIADFEIQVNNLKRECEKHSKSAEKFRLQNEEFSNEIKQHNEEAEEFEARIKNITNSQEQLKKNLAKEQQENMQLKAQLDEKNAEAAEFSKKYEQINSDFKDIQLKFAQSREENQDLMQNMQKLQDKLSNVTNNLEKVKLDANDIKLSAEGQNAQLQSEIRNLKKLNSALQAENAQQTDLISQQKKQIDDLNNESEKLRKNLNDLNLDIKNRLEVNEQNLTSENNLLKDKIQQISDQLNNANKLLSDTKTKNSDLKSKIENLEDQLNENKVKIAESNDVIDKLRKARLQNKDVNIKLEDENNKLTRENSDLQNQIAILKAQIQRITIRQSELQNMNEDKETQNTDLKMKLNELQNDLNEILSAAGVKTSRGAIQEIEKGKKANQTEQNIREILGISIRDDAEKKIGDLQKSLKSLFNVFGTNDFDQIFNVKKEFDSVCALVKNNKKPSDGVAELLINQNEMQDFIAQILQTLSGNTSKIPIFPMNPARNSQILGILKKSADQAKNDHHTVDSIIERAIGMGYTGDNGIEAVDYIISKCAIEERQVILEQMSQQLADLRNQLAKEVESHKKEIEQKTKELAESRKSALQLSQKNKIEREELLSSNSQLEQRIMKLNDELNTEKSLRKELSRVGAGMSADKKLLKSKLSSQEFRLIELVEKLVKSEKESRAIHDNLKKIREENLGAFV